MNQILKAFSGVFLMGVGAVAPPQAGAFEGENAYGPGVHRDIYGRAYQYRTFDGRVVRDHIDVDRQGMDMGTDQYGRTVRTYDLDGRPLPGVPEIPDSHAPLESGPLKRPGR